MKNVNFLMSENSIFKFSTTGKVFHEVFVMGTKTKLLSHRP